MKPVDWAVAGVVKLIERGLIPEAGVRSAIRALIGQRYRQLYRGTQAEQQQRSQNFLRLVQQQDQVAWDTDKANEQHYEVPAEFFDLVLGPHKKYSCCYYTDPQQSLESAEVASLQHTCRHADLHDGQSILELGCGWGSLTLWMLAHYPRAHVTAVSNSHSQRQWIWSQAEQRGLSDRLTIITCDINRLELEQQFDRVVSVEMFEHVRNHQKLLASIAGWLHPQGRLFVHIFCHRLYAYPFETQGAANWMGQYFFTGGMMPHQALFAELPEHFQVEQEWIWNGQHYAHTSNAWARRMDERRPEVMAVLTRVYGANQARVWFHRWKIFFLAVAELFDYRQGTEWYVTHYRLAPVAFPAARNSLAHSGASLS